jgi:hypothetical protein
MAYGRESNNIWLIYEPKLQEEGPKLDHKSMPPFRNKADNNTLPPLKIPWISSFRRPRWKCGVYCSRWVTSIHKHPTKLKCAVLIYIYTNVCWVVVLPNYSTNYKLSNNNIIIRVAPNIPPIQAIVIVNTSNKVCKIFSILTTKHDKWDIISWYIIQMQPPGSIIMTNQSWTIIWTFLIYS